MWSTASAYTTPPTPPLTGAQFVPSHCARFVAATPPIFVKPPPTNTLLPSTATAATPPGEDPGTPNCSSQESPARVHWQKIVTGASRMERLLNIVWHPKSPVLAGSRSKAPQHQTRPSLRVTAV